MIRERIVYLFIFTVFELENELTWIIGSNLNVKLQEIEHFLPVQIPITISINFFKSISDILISSFFVSELLQHGF